MKKQGDIIIISGPSGVGKSTLVGKVRAEIPELEFSISCTTRAPRPGEVDGREYYFLTEAEFAAHRAAGDFLESAGVFSHAYGTLKSEVLGRVRQGKRVLLDIDLQGAKQIRAAADHDPELAASTLLVMIAPPSLEVLEQRLRGRQSDSEEQITQRLAAARRELAGYRIYDYLVVNDDLEAATRELLAILTAARARTSVIVEAPFEVEK